MRQDEREKLLTADDAEEFPHGMQSVYVVEGEGGERLKAAIVPLDAEGRAKGCLMALDSKGGLIKSEKWTILGPVGEVGQ